MERGKYNYPFGLATNGVNIQYINAIKKIPFCREGIASTHNYLLQIHTPQIHDNRRTNEWNIQPILMVSLTTRKGNVPKCHGIGLE